MLVGVLGISKTKKRQRRWFMVEVAKTAVQGLHSQYILIIFESRLFVGTHDRTDKTATVSGSKLLGFSIKLSPGKKVFLFIRQQ